MVISKSKSKQDFLPLETDKLVPKCFWKSKNLEQLEHKAEGLADSLESQPFPPVELLGWNRVQRQTSRWTVTEVIH